MVLIVGQNSVWQNTYNVPSLERGAVNRMAGVFASAAGKGTNVARALLFLGHESLLLAYAGGPNGDKFAVACEADGIRTDLTRIERETRMCTTLIENSGTITEIVEPAPSISASERKAFRARFSIHLSETSMLVISGTAMRGESKDCYLEFASEAHARGIPVVLDSYRAHGKLALDTSPEVLKVNADELAELSGGDCRDAAGRRKAAAFVRDRYGVRWVIITRGKEGAEAFDEGRSFSCKAPLVKVKNTIGSGDAFTAGVVATLLENVPEPSKNPGRSSFPWNVDLGEAATRGTAMGSANCMNIKPGLIERADYEHVLASISVRALG